jgi:uncharacterized phage protein gp47/JayE
MAGLTENGFEIKSEEDVVADIQSEIDAQFGAINGAKLSIGPMATMVRIVARLCAALWLLALTVYNSQSPSSAFGVLLDRLLELTSIVRELAKTSTAFVVAYGTNGTLLSLGRRIQNAVTLTYWQTTEAATIATVSAWSGSTVFEKYDLVTNDTGKLYVCTSDDGTSAGSGGPTGTGTAIVDGSCTWRYVATATAGVVIPVESELEGQVVGAAGDLNVIDSAVGGWDGVANPLDAAMGREIETDAQVRVRRRALIRQTGNAAVDAILADVAKVEGVTQVFCFKNETILTDGDGVPGKSVEVLVQGGDDVAIATALLGTVAAGIETHGTNSENVVDSQGFTWEIKFSRPTVVEIYAEVDIVADAVVPAGKFPADGDAQIKQAMVDFSFGLPVGGVQFSYGTLGIGDDVVADQLRTPIKQVSGVPKVSAIRLGIAPSPVSTSDYAITARQVAELDTSRILVTHV